MWPAAAAAARWSPESSGLEVFLDDSKHSQSSDTQKIPLINHLEPTTSPPPWRLEFRSTSRHSRMPVGDLKEELRLINLSLTIRIRHMLFGAIFFWNRPSTWNLQKVNKTINKRGYFKFELLHPLVVILKHAASARLCWKLNTIFSAPISVCVLMLLNGQILWQHLW